MIQSKYDNVELAARFIFVAERFKNIAKMYGGRVNFMVGGVPSKPGCGTVACHGGWAGVALIPNPNERTESLYDWYWEGARVLAQYLGFKTPYHYEHWAEENPELWGGRDGFRMFNCNGFKAFGGYSDEDVQLVDIAAWYIGVAKRLLQRHRSKAKMKPSNALTDRSTS